MLRTHPAAHKHGYSVEDISHAYDMALYEGTLDPDREPPKLLILGPDPGGNILELVGGEFPGDEVLIWHAMPCRPKYHSLLPEQGAA